MALKLNLKSEIEEEMERLLPKVRVRSKTEYINRAIEEYNRKIKRELEIIQLKGYFQRNRREARQILHEFSQIRTNRD